MRVITVPLWLAAALALAPIVAAEEPARRSAEKQIQAMVEDIGQPARREKVDAWLARAEEGEGETRGLLAQAVGRCGGREAVLGLLSLEKRFKDRVVGDVLTGTVGVGLRWPGLEKPAERTLFYSRDPELRILALRALGRIGDGRHMQALLDGAASMDRRVRKAAYTSMRLLSGVKLPAELKRWEYWWRQAEGRGRRDLRLARAKLERAAGATQAPLWRGVLHRTAWMDIDEARLIASTWLASGDARLQVEAARLIRHLRLADLGAPLEEAARRVEAKTARAVIAQALTSLGHASREVLPAPVVRTAR